MLYNWQLPDWPNFSYLTDKFEEKIYQYTEQLGFMQAKLEHVPQCNQSDIVISLMVDEAMHTARIEGEYLQREDVMSSIKGRLGIPTSVTPHDVRAIALADLLYECHATYADLLTEQMLWHWHETLLGYAGKLGRLQVGGWRDHEEPMQIISGAIGKSKIHFEAPPSKDVPALMTEFIKWFNDTAPGGKTPIYAAPIRAALVHLYFESVHPFEDGNGRIGRMLSVKALSQACGCPVPFSISTCIEAKRKDYYQALKQAQRTNDVNQWLTYFIDMLLSAQEQAKIMVEFVLRKTQFFDQHSANLNERQRKVIEKMLSMGPKGFEGGLTAKKYIAMTRCSKATATRDLSDLLDKKILKLLSGGGRSTHYDVLL